MKITRIREATAPIASEIRNAYISFSTMTISLVAVETDVVREGQAGDRLRLHLQRPLCAGRHPARALHPAHHGGRRRSRSSTRRTTISIPSPSGRPSWPTRSPAATATGRTPPARSTWRSGMRWPRSRASRCGGCCPSASTAAASTRRCSSIRAAATTTPARSSRACRAEMRGYQEQGYKVVKMKIGGADLATDLKRIEAVHRGRRRGRERRRRRQRPLRPRHRAGLRQGDAALRSVLVRGAGRPARLPAQCQAGRALSPARWRRARTCSRPSTAATCCATAACAPTATGCSSTRRSPTASPSICAFSMWPRRWAGRAGGSSRTAGISWRSTSRPACRLGGSESYPGVFQPYGGFADDIPIVDGYVRPARGARHRHGAQAQDVRRDAQAIGARSDHPPLDGEGGEARASARRAGWGEATSGDACGLTPTPNPSPQGGGGPVGESGQ